MVMSFFASAISSPVERTEWPTLSLRSHSKWRIASAAALTSALGALGGQHHQVEVAVGRHLPAAGAAETDQGDLAADRRADHALGHIIISEADDLVVEEGSGLCGGAAAAGFLGQAPADLRASGFERLAQDRGHFAALLLARREPRRSAPSARADR